MGTMLPDSISRGCLSWLFMMSGRSWHLRLELDFQMKVTVQNEMSLVDMIISNHGWEMEVHVLGVVLSCMMNSSCIMTMSKVEEVIS